MSIIKHVTLQKIVAHDFRYDPRMRRHIFMYATKSMCNIDECNIKRHRTKLATRVTTCSVIYAPLANYVYVSVFVGLIICVVLNDAVSSFRPAGW